MRKIIDFHQHLVLPIKKHLPIMDRTNIERAIVMPFSLGGMNWKEALACVGMNKKPKKFVRKVLESLHEANLQLQEKVREQDRLTFVPWVSAFTVDTMEQLRDYDSPIIKFIPVFDNVVDDYYKRMEIMVAFAPQNIIMIHTGWGSRIKPLKKMLDEFSDKIFVIAHMKEDDDSYNDERLWALERYKRYKNVYVETSYAPHSKRIWQYVKKGYGDRLLFGSDFRTSDDEQSIRNFIKMIEEADISETDKNNIFYNNAQRLLGL